jgi:hypothetical protein
MPSHEIPRDEPLQVSIAVWRSSVCSRWHLQAGSGNGNVVSILWSSVLVDFVSGRWRCWRMSGGCFCQNRLGTGSCGRPKYRPGLKELIVDQIYYFIFEKYLSRLGDAFKKNYWPISEQMILGKGGPAIQLIKLVWHYCYCILIHVG